MLIDSNANHEIFSFVDGFNGYNQIKVDPEDAKKTTLNYFWKVLLHGDAIWIGKC